MSKVALSQVTAEFIASATGSALVEAYNVIAKALQKDTVKRFSDAATGRKRVTVLLAELNEVNEKSKAKAAPASAPAPAPKAAPAPTAKAAPAPTAKAAPAPKPSKASADKAAPARRRGTNIVPLGFQPEACREGSKQAALLDALQSEKGVTMDQLIVALSGGNKPWTEATVRSGFGWDLKNKGYGVRSEFDTNGVERFFIVLPEKFQIIPNHTPLKTAKPKAHAAQLSL